MANISAHSSAKTVKLLVVGDSGSGKSGAGASLAAAGYNVRYLDVDNGLDVVRNVLMDPKSPYAKGSSARVEFETVTDAMRSVGGKMVPATASVWTRCMNLLSNWSPETTKLWPGHQPENATAALGPITAWTDQDVLCIDSLTFLAKGAMNHILALNGRLGQTPFESDWYQAQGLLEGLLEMLYDTSVKCNVIVNAHIVYIGKEGEQQRGYPASLGKALSPKIGRYFNSCVMTKTVGVGTAVRRVISTNSTPFIELKSSSPLRVKPEYALANGMAELFKDLRGES